MVHGHCPVAGVPSVVFLISDPWLLTSWLPRGRANVIWTGVSDQSRQRTPPRDRSLEECRAKDAKGAKVVGGWEQG